MPTGPRSSRLCRGKLGVATRYSHTLQQNMMYVALPVSEDESGPWLRRAALPVRTIDPDPGIGCFTRSSTAAWPSP